MSRFAPHGKDEIDASILRTYLVSPAQFSGYFSGDLEQCLWASKARGAVDHFDLSEGHINRDARPFHYPTPK